MPTYEYPKIISSGFHLVLCLLLCAGHDYEAVLAGA